MNIEKISNKLRVASVGLLLLSGISTAFSVCDGATLITNSDPTLWCAPSGYVVEGNCKSWCCPDGKEYCDTSTCTTGQPHFVNGQYVACNPATYGYTVDPTKPHIVCPSVIAVE